MLCCCQQDPAIQQARSNQQPATAVDDYNPFAGNAAHGTPQVIDYWVMMQLKLLIQVIVPWPISHVVQSVTMDENCSSRFNVFVDKVSYFSLRLRFASAVSLLLLMLSLQFITLAPGEEGEGYASGFVCPGV